MGRILIGLRAYRQFHALSRMDFDPLESRASHPEHGRADDADAVGPGLPRADRPATSRAWPRRAKDPA